MMLFLGCQKYREVVDDLLCERGTAAARNDRDDFKNRVGFDGIDT